jgi:hypothetical protein
MIGIRILVAKKDSNFYTEGSRPWKVLYFRQESDEGGPYIAVGLKPEPDDPKHWKAL